MPQSIFLADCSIAENIAFGQNKVNIDFEKVKKAVKKAQLVDFIKKSPNGINTIVGERGIKLSGGQRQRIALARAFYREANIFILDEATSSLDQKTEDEIINDFFKFKNATNSNNTIALHFIVKCVCLTRYVVVKQKMKNLISFNLKLCKGLTHLCQEQTEQVSFFGQKSLD